MHILSLAKYAYFRYGGIERHVEDLYTGLVKYGHKVTALSYSPIQRAAFLVNGVRVIPVKSSIQLGSQSISVEMVKQLRAIAGDITDVDLVHAHFPDPWAHFAMTFLPARLPKVVTWHSDVVKQRVLGPLYRQSAQLVLCRLDGVLAASAHHLRSGQIPAYLSPQTQRFVAPYGIDTLRLTQQSDRVSGLTFRIQESLAPSLIIFALGRHVYYKGFEYLIDAVGQMEGVHLLLGGEGPLTDTLKSRAAMFPTKVTMVGRIEDQDLPAYFRACDVFCLPSIETSEAFGLVQAEAMAFSKPVVNCALGNAVNEVSLDQVTGLTVPTRSSEALAQALGRLQNDTSLRLKLGRAAKDRVERCYSIDAMIQSTVQAYERIIEQRHR